MLKFRLKIILLVFNQTAMLKYCFIFLIIFSFCSCRSDGKFQNILHPNSITSSFYTVHIGQDTVLITAKGAKIQITKNSIHSKNKQVQLEIKEAYSMEEIWWQD